MLRTPDEVDWIGARGPNLTKDCFFVGGRSLRLWRHQVKLSTVFCGRCLRAQNSWAEDRAAETQTRRGVGRPSMGVEYDIGSLFRNHVDRTDDEEAGDAGKHGRIHDAQSLGAVYPEVAGQRPTAVASTNGATAGSVMSPGVVSHKGPQGFRRGHIASRGFLFVQHALSLEGRRHAADEGDTIYNRFEILVVPLLEGVEINRRDIPRVGGAKRDRASAISGVAFQYYPGEIVEVFHEGLGISGAIPL